MSSKTSATREPHHSKQGCRTVSIRNEMKGRHIIRNKWKSSEFILWNFVLGFAKMGIRHVRNIEKNTEKESLLKVSSPGWTGNPGCAFSGLNNIYTVFLCSYTNGKQAMQRSQYEKAVIFFSKAITLQPEQVMQQRGHQGGAECLFFFFFLLKFCK